MSRDLCQAFSAPCSRLTRFPLDLNYEREYDSECDSRQFLRVSAFAAFPRFQLMDRYFGNTHRVE